MPGKKQKSHAELRGEFFDQKYHEEVDNLIVIDNVPKVEPAKTTKLLAMLQKKIKDKVKAEPRSIELVRDDTGISVGFCFVEFSTPEEAKTAVATLNKYQLDKSHVFLCNNFSEWEKLGSVPDEYTEPRIQDHTRNISENPHEYLCDKATESEPSLAREQYLIRVQAGQKDKEPTFEYQVYTHDYQIGKDSEIKEVMKLEARQVDGVGPWVQWSPQGSYLVVVTDKGVQLYGGKDMAPMGKFNHNDVQMIEFSQKERYLMTWCTKSELHVWDVAQGKKLRRFKALPNEQVNVPIKLYRWGPDERFLVRLEENNILMHDLNDNLRLIMPDPDKPTSIHVPGLRCETYDREKQRQVDPPVEWSPTDNLISYWVPERGQTPAKVAVVEVVVKKRQGQPDEITFEPRAERNIFGVQRVHMKWHPQGDFLACKVEREKKGAGGRTIISSYEMFRVRGGKKEWAVETLEITDHVVAFDWEPKGHRFAVVHGARPSEHAVSFYTMGGIRKGELKLIRKLAKKEVNGVYWSPRGHHAVLAGSDQPFNGKVVEFWDVDALERLPQAAKPEALASAEHHMLSAVAWDASGRYVSTYVDRYHLQGMTQEHGFRVWTFQGKLTVEKKLQNMWQFQWRPRPPTFLGEAETRRLAKTRKAWEEKYRELDESEGTRIQREEEEKKKSITMAFMRRKAEIRKLHQDKGYDQVRTDLWTTSGATFHLEGTGFRWKTDTVDELIKKHPEEKL